MIVSLLLRTECSLCEVFHTVVITAVIYLSVTSNISIETLLKLHMSGGAAGAVCGPDGTTLPALVDTS